MKKHITIWFVISLDILSYFAYPFSRLMNHAHRQYRWREMFPTDTEHFFKNKWLLQPTTLPYMSVTHLLTIDKLVVEEEKCDVVGPHASCDSHNLPLMDQLWTMLNQVLTLWQKILHIKFHRSVLFTHDFQTSIKKMITCDTGRSGNLPATSPSGANVQELVRK